MSMQRTLKNITITLLASSRDFSFCNILISPWQPDEIDAVKWPATFEALPCYARTPKRAFSEAIKFFFARKNYFLTPQSLFPQLPPPRFVRSLLNKINEISVQHVPGHLEKVETWRGNSEKSQIFYLWFRVFYHKQYINIADDSTWIMMW